MKAVDTNILVRLLTTDHPAQAAAARTLFESGRIWIGKTVLLETAWVLRSVYGFAEPAICDAFAKLLGLNNIDVEDETDIWTALELTKQGIEFADALHLSSRPANAIFVTFDRTLVTRARRAGLAGVSSAQRAL